MTEWGIEESDRDAGQAEEEGEEKGRREGRGSLSWGSIDDVADIFARGGGGGGMRGGTGGRTMLVPLWLTVSLKLLLLLWCVGGNLRMVGGENEAVDTESGEMESGSEK